MTQKKQKPEKLDEEIIFEDGAEGSLSFTKKKNDKLKEAIKKQHEYLDGWQRARAELVNYRKEAEEKITRARGRGHEDILHDLLPTLDAFDMAINGEAWNNVDPTWRQGVEYIHNQLLQILNDNNVVEIGVVGEKFDPEMHDAVDRASDNQEHSVNKVLQKGYKINDRIIRPARVELS